MLMCLMRWFVAASCCVGFVDNAFCQMTEKPAWPANVPRYPMPKTPENEDEIYSAYAETVLGVRLRQVKRGGGEVLLEEVDADGRAHAAGFRKGDRLDGYWGRGNDPLWCFVSTPAVLGRCIHVISQSPDAWLVLRYFEVDEPPVVKDEQGRPVLNHARRLIDLKGVKPARENPNRWHAYQVGEYWTAREHIELVRCIMGVETTDKPEKNIFFSVYPEVVRVLDVITPKGRRSYFEGVKVPFQLREMNHVYEPHRDAYRASMSLHSGAAPLGQNLAQMVKRVTNRRQQDVGRFKRENTCHFKLSIIDRRAISVGDVLPMTGSVQSVREAGLFADWTVDAFIAKSQQDESAGLIAQYMLLKQAKDATDSAVWNKKIDVLIKDSKQLCKDDAQVPDGVRKDAARTACLASYMGRKENANKVLYDYLDTVLKADGANGVSKHVVDLFEMDVHPPAKRAYALRASKKNLSAEAMTCFEEYMSYVDEWNVAKGIVSSVDLHVKATTMLSNHEPFMHQIDTLGGARARLEWLLRYQIVSTLRNEVKYLPPIPTTDILPVDPDDAPANINAEMVGSVLKWCHKTLAADDVWKIQTAAMQYLVTRSRLHPSMLILALECADRVLSNRHATAQTKAEAFSVRAIYLGCKMPGTELEYGVRLANQYDDPRKKSILLLMVCRVLAQKAEAEANEEVSRWQDRVFEMIPDPEVKKYAAKHFMNPR